jgi:hypothetical protein
MMNILGGAVPVMSGIYNHSYRDYIPTDEALSCTPQVLYLGFQEGNVKTPRYLRNIQGE